jgi:DNA-directed RNA polymerase subunit M/transcription elongation factor TFIIS
VEIVLRKPKVLRPESRDYGELRCPNCGASTILRLGTSNVVVWDYKTKEYVVVNKELPKDGMLSARQFKSTFLCQACGHEWSIISGV